jgi:hypothetical protein
MRKCIVFLLLLIFITQPVLADDNSIDPMRVGANMVTTGIANVFTKAADSCFSLGFNATTEEMNIHENYGYAVNAIYLITTIEYNPLDNSFVKDMMAKTAVVGLFLIMFYILLGGTAVNLSNIDSSMNYRKIGILGNNYNLPLNEYATTIMKACLLMIFGYVIIYFSITIESIFTKLLMIEILDRITPTSQNVIMYCMMAFCYLIMSLAIAYRLLIISIFAAGYMVIVGLYCFGITRDAAIACFWYFEKMLFMRTIIVGITVIGVGITSSFKISPEPIGVVEGLAYLYLQPLMYAALILILVITSLKLIFGIKSIFSTAHKIIRTVKYTNHLVEYL